MRWRFTLNPDTDNKVISEPIGWPDIVLTLKRDKQWHGVFFEYSLPLEFYNDPEDSTKDAADYLRTEYDANGVEGFVILQVELACGDAGAFEEQGQWRMNFTSFEELISDICTIKLNMEPENCLMTFRNRYNQKVDIETLESFEGSELSPYDNLPTDIDVPPVVTLQIATINSPGPVTDDSAFFEAVETDVVTAGSGTAVHDYISYAQFGMNPGTGHSSLDGLDDLDEIATRNSLSNEMWNSFEVSSLYEFALDGEYEFHFTYNGVGQIFCETNANNTDCGGDQNTFNAATFVVILAVGGTDYTLYSETDTGCFEDNYLFSSVTVIDQIQTVVVTAGQQAKLYVRMEGEGEWDQDLINDHDILWRSTLRFEMNLTIFAKTQKAATPHPFFLINETGSRILEAITDDCLRLLSNYYGRTDSQPYTAPANLDGKGSLRALTTGLLLRNYTDTGKLILSFQEFFQALKAIDNIGIGMEPDPDRAGFEVVRMESAEYFYDSTILIQLDKVPKCVITVLQDEHFSLIKSGYSTYEAEEYYGLDEFNTDREYRTSLQSVNNSMEQLCDWIASGYAIELTRRKAPTSTTTKEDWRFDNDTFILCLTRGENAFVAEQGNVSSPVNFVDPDSILNYRISPVRNMLRWIKSVIASYRNPDDVANALNFVTGTGNIIAEGMLTGAYVDEASVIAENEDLTVNSLADSGTGLPIYVPELWTFEYPLSLTEYNILKANPRGTIQARFGQQEFSRDFFIRQIDYAPNKGTAIFKLLPKASYPIDECCFYIIQQTATGDNTLGSSALTGADISNLFCFVGKELYGYNDANSANNEIQSWNSDFGFATLRPDINIPAGTQITILHIPPMGLCNPCIKRFEGRGNGTDTVEMAGFGSAALGDIFVFYGKNLMGYNDANPINNELSGYTPGTEEVEFTFPTNADREIRAFAFIQCDQIGD